MKKCTRCGLEKENEQFYGKDYWCKQCHSEYYKKKSYSQYGKKKQVREDLSNGNRVCNTCESEKVLEDFPKNKKCSLGRERTCKQCSYKAREKQKDKNKQVKKE